jgi:Mce-associated membrane protein
MTSTPRPTWYVVLGVSRDASAEEIKAAWRHATDRFEPGSGTGQFRMFNEAADVLLDPARRAAYDADLDAPADAPPPPAPVGDEPTPAVTASTQTAPTTEVDPRTGRREERARAREARRAEKAAASTAAVEPASTGAKLALAVLAVLTVAALALAVVFGMQLRSDARVADARDEAPAAAENAAKALFSYDYRHLPADRQRASGFVTDSFGKKYLKNFSQLEKQKDGSPGLAVQSKTVVTASVQASGVVDAEDGLARVLVFVNQTSQKPGADPQIFQNRVAMTMKQHDDRWLVDDVKSY